MLTPAKFKKLSDDLKKYNKYLSKNNFDEIDESKTRSIIDRFLMRILGYDFKDIGTEYRIKDKYVDYAIKLEDPKRKEVVICFIVEVKAYKLKLSENHLRQAIDYATDEGIDWVLLTNARQFDLYKILWGKPIDKRKVFTVDLLDKNQLKESASNLQYLHKDVITKGSLDSLWAKCDALDPITVANILCGSYVINHIKRTLKNEYKYKPSDQEIINSIKRVFKESIDVENKIKGIKKTRKSKPSGNKKTKVCKDTINGTQPLTDLPT